MWMKYENALKKKFPEQVRDIYISYVHKTGRENRRQKTVQGADAVP